MTFFDKAERARIATSGAAATSANILTIELTETLKLAVPIAQAAIELAHRFPSLQ